MQSTSETRHVILSGCSGGGKSSVLAELARRGFVTVEEPGRRIVAEELAGDGAALPWRDLDAFARRALDLASRDRADVMAARGWVFFDRGLIDAALAMERATGRPAADTLHDSPRFHAQVFLTPPWPEIYQRDAERQQDIKEGLREYEHILGALPALGYTPVILPKLDVAARVDFILSALRII